MGCNSAHYTELMHDKLSKLPVQGDEGLHKDSDIPHDHLPAKPLREAAVLMPLVWHDAAWQLIFIRRASNDKDRHSGQVAFPGGRKDPADTSAEETALREAHEEIGVHPSKVSLLGRLYDYTTISYYKVTPVVGTVEWPQPLTLQQSEVSRAFTIPLQWLTERDNFTLRGRDELDPDTARRHPIIVYEPYDGEVLWGASARMTMNLIKAIDEGKMKLPERT